MCIHPHIELLLLWHALGHHFSYLKIFFNVGVEGCALDGALQSVHCVCCVLIFLFVGFSSVAANVDNSCLIKSGVWVLWLVHFALWKIIVVINGCIFIQAYANLFAVIAVY